MSMTPPKAADADFLGRWREVISDPLNLLIERVPMAGMVEGTDVYLHNGNRVPVIGEHAYYGSYSKLLVLNRGVHEPLEEYVFQQVTKILPVAPLMIELGAYWGHYSMWLKKVRPQSTTILVEPEAANLAAGAYNFDRNGLTGEFIQGFVGTGQLEIDAFCDSRMLAKIDILHADVQGYELQMLTGARRTLGERRADYLFVSTHGQEMHAAVVTTLSGLGYRVEAASDFEETTSFDGFVFASSPNVLKVFRKFSVIGRTAIAESSPERLLRGLLEIESQG
jgi:Methyltransferase FkbM domain